MKKIFRILLIILVISISLCSNEVKAAQYFNIPYDVWTHVEGDSIGISIPIQDKNTKIKIEIINLITVPDRYASYSNNDLVIQWDAMAEDLEVYHMNPGITSFTQEVKTGDYKDNKIHIWGNDMTSFSFDIRLTNLGVEYNEDDYDKTSGKVTPQDYCYSNKCEVQVTTKSEFGVKKIKLYRKDSKNGKYKLVKTLYDGSDLMLETIIDKGLKPNKQYWYKVKTLGWYSLGWSDYSPEQSYWTCPTKVIGKKRTGNILTWKKVKGVSGYIVDVEYEKFVGYNILGQRLIDSYTKSYFVKGTRYKITDKQVVGTSVRGYAIHNGKYYCTDSSVVKKKNAMKNNTVTRYRE